MSSRDLVIIGGGAGGLVVASVAAQLGLKVTLVERASRLGGDCLHEGCVPSKTFIHSAKVASLMRRAAQFGLPTPDFEVDLGAVADHVQAVISRIQQHDDPERFRGYGCEVLLGEAARFTSPHEVRVGTRTLRARRFVIATGSRPLIPFIAGLAESDFLTSLNVFHLRNLPRRLVVLGAGPVGVELAQAFARFGSHVTLIEQRSHLLPSEDPEISEALRACLVAENIDVRTSTLVERVENHNAVKLIHCRDGQALETDALLVAVGRRSNVEGLDLEVAQVRHSELGIQVDSRLRTNQHHIYACGDICGPHAFTHMAEYQAGIVIANAVFRIPRRVDYRVVPRVTFTDPEVAQVGLLEAEARKRGIEPTVLRLPFASVDRAIMQREEAGLVKLVAQHGRLVGASLLGPQAGELIHELALAIKSRASLAAISATIHAYPTLAQVHRRAANLALVPRLFSPATRRLVHWLQRLVP